jgi:hypothetical protein
LTGVTITLEASPQAAPSRTLGELLLVSLEVGGLLLVSLEAYVLVFFEFYLYINLDYSRVVLESSIGLSK